MSRTMCTRRTVGSLLVAAAALFVAIPAASAQVFLQQGKKNGVAFVGGGIGLTELAALKAREGEFTLKLVFTLVEGNYLAGVDVAVRDAKGRTVAELANTGPVFMANLPPGTYTVTAKSRKRELTRKVQIGKRLRIEYLRWPSVAKEDYVTAADEPERKPAAARAAKP